MEYLVCCRSLWLLSGYIIYPSSLDKIRTRSRGKLFFFLYLGNKKKCHLKNVWNGAVDATLTLLAAIFALFAGFIHGARLNPRGSLLALAVLSIMEGGAVLLSCWTTSIVWSYIGYIIFGALYAFTITVSGYVQ